MGTTSVLRHLLHDCGMEWKDQSSAYEDSTAIRTATGWVFAYTMNDNLGTLDVEIDSITPDQVLDVVRALNPTPCEDRPTPKHMAQERGFSGHFDTANGMPTCRASVTLSQASQAAGSPRF